MLCMKEMKVKFKILKAQAGIQLWTISLRVFLVSSGLDGLWGKSVPSIVFRPDTVASFPPVVIRQPGLQSGQLGALWIIDVNISLHSKLC